jgi:hypothetical protein
MAFKIIIVDKFNKGVLVSIISVAKRFKNSVIENSFLV